MLESLIGLAVASEVPIVVVDVMRGGPSTGIPAKSEQSDVSIALWGLHGDAPRLVLAPNSIADCLATTQWAVHLAESPGKQAELWLKAWRKAHRLALWTLNAANPSGSLCIEPLAQDRRFRDPAWREWPFNLLFQGFLLCQQWWYNATTGVRGVSPHHEDVVWFAARQWLDMFSPSNFVASTAQVFPSCLKSSLHDSAMCAAQAFLPGVSALSVA